MIKIPPDERFNQHSGKAMISALQVREAITQHGMNPEKCRIRKLSGGFQNTNYLVENDQKLVFRFYSANLETADREAGVLKFLENQDVQAPVIKNFFELSDIAVVVMEFMEGELLQDLLISSSVGPEVFHQIGQELGKIHEIQLPKTGFIGANMKIGGEFENFSTFLRNFAEKVLKHLQEERLEKSLAERLLRLIQDKWSLVEQTEPACQLVHCDFNPKNILISSGNDFSPIKVLDWEFCLSGNGYIDLGNFFRFSQDYPVGTESLFIQGYESIHGKISPQWRQISRLMDLGNMLSFLEKKLERKEDYEKTFRTARAVIEDTLSNFGF